MPRTSFGVILNERLITSYEVNPKDTLGIQVRQAPIPGIVSFYEEHDCRLEAGYTIPEWYNLDSRERAVELAMYRIRSSIEYQKMKAQERAAERSRRK